MKDWWIGGLKVATFLLLLCFIYCVTNALFATYKKVAWNVSFCIIIVHVLGIAIRWLTDVILFGLNKIHDENGIKLAPPW